MVTTIPKRLQHLPLSGPTLEEFRRAFAAAPGGFWLHRCACGVTHAIHVGSPHVLVALSLWDDLAEHAKSPGFAYTLRPVAIDPRQDVVCCLISTPE